MQNVGQIIMNVSITSFYRVLTYSALFDHAQQLILALFLVSSKPFLVTQKGKVHFEARFCPVAIVCKLSMQNVDM